MAKADNCVHSILAWVRGCNVEASRNNPAADTSTKMPRMMAPNNIFTTVSSLKKMDVGGGWDS